MALVLFDGSMPSVKALEAGCAQGFFCQHNRDQLVILHATPPVQQSSTAAAAAASLAGSVTHSGGGRGSVAGASTISSQQQQHDPNSADPSTTTAANNTAAMATSVSAISQVVDNIQKNRFASSSLNYKLETFRMSCTMPHVLAAQRAAAEKHAKEQQAAEQAAMQSPATGSPRGGGGGAAAAAAAPNKASSQHAAASSSSHAANAAALFANSSSSQDQEPPTLQTCFAENVALRANHHKARTVLLGVGSSGGHGKALVLGGFARAAVDRLRCSGEIDCVGIFKPSGPPVRSTQPMRVVVVVTPTTTIDIIKGALSKIPYLSAARGDFVGLLVVMNSCKAKPKSLVEALSALEQQRAQQAALGVGAGAQVQPPTSQEQLSMIKIDEEGESGPHWRKVVEATLKLAGDVSRLGFLNQEERMQQLLQMEQNEDQPTSGRSAGAATASPNAASPSVALSATAASTSAGFEGPHLLSTFWIEPTNRDPAPDLEAHTGCAQLGKAAAGLKTDYCVVPSAVGGAAAEEETKDAVLGPNATNCLLSVVRPHVLLM